MFSYLFWGSGRFYLIIQWTLHVKFRRALGGSSTWLRYIRMETSLVVRSINGFCLQPSLCAFCDSVDDATFVMFICLHDRFYFFDFIIVDCEDEFRGSRSCFDDFKCIEGQKTLSTGYSTMMGHLISSSLPAMIVLSALCWDQARSLRVWVTPLVSPCFILGTMSWRVRLIVPSYRCNFKLCAPPRCTRWFECSPLLESISVLFVDAISSWPPCSLFRRRTVVDGSCYYLLLMLQVICPFR